MRMMGRQVVWDGVVLAMKRERQHCNAVNGQGKAAKGQRSRKGIAAKGQGKALPHLRALQDFAGTPRAGRADEWVAIVVLDNLKARPQRVASSNRQNTAMEAQEQGSFHGRTGGCSRLVDNLVGRRDLEGGPLVGDPCQMTSPAPARQAVPASPMWHERDDQICLIHRLVISLVGKGSAWPTGQDA